MTELTIRLDGLDTLKALIGSFERSVEELRDQTAKLTPPSPICFHRYAQANRYSRPACVHCGAPAPIPENWPYDAN